MRLEMEIVELPMASVVARWPGAMAALFQPQGSYLLASTHVKPLQRALVGFVSAVVRVRADGSEEVVGQVSVQPLAVAMASNRETCLEWPPLLGASFGKRAARMLMKRHRSTATELPQLASPPSTPPSMPIMPLPPPATAPTVAAQRTRVRRPRLRLGSGGAARSVEPEPEPEPQPSPNVLSSY